MIKFRSIRVRLTVSYAAILTASLLAFSLLVWSMMRERLLHDLRHNLDEEATRFSQFVAAEAADPAVDLPDEMEEFSRGLPSGSYITVTSASGVPLFRYPANTVADRNRYEVLTSEMPIRGARYVLELGAARAQMHRAMELLETLLWSLVPAVIALATLGGAWMSRRALNPVDEVTRAARSIGIENLSNRLPSPGTGDELDRLTDTWNDMLARLEMAVASLSRFTADASHELRTPVAVIRTAAEVALRRDREPDAYRDALRQISRESERMTQLVEDLLFLARRDARADAMPMEQLDLRDVLSSAIDEVRPLASARVISIDFDPSPEPSNVTGNSAGLRRLFLALLDNAIKYSPDGATVTAAVEGTAVSIRDHGPGIAAENIPHIFERFYRGDKSRTGSGYGLGLSLAQNIVAMHGAEITVESEPGNGSVFKVTFGNQTL